MAVYLRWLRFLLLFHSLISLLQHVLGTQGAFISVPAPYVYVIAGKQLSLDCTVNGSALSISQISWKHDGRWLHNQTRRLASKVQLILRNVTRQQDGLYQCGVFTVSGPSQSQNEVIPKDGNVTILVGDPINKPMCISNGLIPPKVLLIWNVMNDYRSVFQFTYNVLYCHKPSFANKFCFRHSYGYNTFKHCSNLSVNSSAMVKCNVTSLFKKLFPHLFDIHEPVVGNPSIFFTVKLGNVQSDIYSYSPILRSCNPLEKVRCTRPGNVRVFSIKRKTLSLVWDAPKGFDDITLHYLLLFSVDGSDKNQTIDFLYAEDLHRVVNISHDLTSLHPYTMHHIYIACSITSVYGETTRGAYIGPFSARTVEEEPSDYPRIVENLTSIVLHENSRDVTFTWTLPDKSTWNGIITHFVLHYWKVNNSMAENGSSRVEVFSNVSNTTGTVTNLRLDEAYAVVAQICTRVGCGPTSERSYIRAEMPDIAETDGPLKKGKTNFFLIIGVISGLTLLIVCAALVAYLWRKQLRKHRSHVERKPPLSEAVDVAPSPYDSPNEPAKIEDSGDYDEAFAPLLSGKRGKTDYVQIRNSQTEPQTLRSTSEHDTADDDNPGSTEV